MIKAILMDFNGVIIDDEPIQHAAYKEIFSADGIDVTDEMYYSRLGMDDKTFVASILEEAGKTAEIDRVLEMTAAKTAHWRKIVSDAMPIFDGVENFVRKSAQELSLGIVSMAKREEIDFVLEKVGIADCFSVVVSAEGVANCKPDPQCYRRGFRELDLARTAQGHLPMVHADCLVIEDSPPGVQAGRAADMPVLAVTNTVSADALRAAGANAIAANLNDWFPETMRRVFV
ncbi:MAG TPA: HAD family phosphatase [Pyrinomonadaceae bacterium]